VRVLANVVSNSWGDHAGDLLDDVATRTAYDDLFMLADSTGMTIQFSSGASADNFGLLGLSAARALTRYRLRGGGLALSFVSLPLFIPDIVLGISLLILVDALGIPLSLLSVIAGHVLVCVPFATAVLISRLEGFDIGLEEASRDLGENAWMTFLRVTLPLALPGIVASLLLSFIVSFDEFLIAYFLAGTDATLPIYIWSELRFPAKLPVVLALGAAILVATCGIVLLAEWVRNFGRTHGKAIKVGA
jgi:spermidine/putrescine transport system permease protein